jgi:hypothetical protein
MTFNGKIENSTLKFTWKHKKLQITKGILSKKSNPEGTTVLNFKLYYRDIAIKIPWYWDKNRYKDQWNRIEDPDMNPQSYSHLILTKVIKICDGEKTASSTNVSGKSGYLPSEN